MIRERFALRWLVVIPFIVGFWGELQAQDMSAGRVMTVAGDTTNGYNGDIDADGVPRPSIGAQLNLPWGLAISGSGRDLYIGDAGNHRVRRVDTAHWDIFTIAGNGSADYRGDGELAVSASIRSPGGVTVDGLGNVYIVDSGNHRVRMVDTEGQIRTIAGGTKAGFDGDGGIATQGFLKSPVDVAVDDQGNVYISDSGNYRIRRVDAATGVISTIAGTGKRKYDGDGKPATEAAISPAGLVLDGAGGLLFADERNHRIRHIDLETGIITTRIGTGSNGFAGDGDIAEGAKLSRPWGVAVSPAGDIFITDSGNNRVRRVSSITGVIETIGGGDSTGFAGDGGRATKAKFQTPYGIAVDQSDNVYVADLMNHRVRRINLRKARVAEHRPRVRPRAKWPLYALGLTTATGGTFFYIWYTGREKDLPKPSFPPSGARFPTGKRR